MAGPSGTTQATDARQALTDNQFALWRELIRERCGTDFTESRRHRLESIIRERLARCRLSSFNEYFNHVSYGDASGAEWLELLDRILNHESFFFRHSPSFDALRSDVLPEIADRKREDGSLRLNLWSAGCARGQEAVSLAVLLAESGYLPVRGSRLEVMAAQSEAWEVSILATDLGRKAVDRVRQGRFPAHEQRGLAPRLRQRYFDTQPDGSIQISADVQRCITARTLDLVTDRFDDVPPQDVIFCQNVLIYFQHAVRVTVADRLVSRLNPGGCLFAGPGELPGYRPAGTQTLKLPDCQVLQRL